MHITKSPFRLTQLSAFRRFQRVQWTRFESSSAATSKRSHEQTNTSTAKPFHAIPGPPMFESLVRYARVGFRDQYSFLETKFQRYGPIFKVVMPGVKLVYVCDPDDIEKVYRNEGYPAKRGNHLAAAFYYIEKGLPKGFTGDDESWHIHRSATAPKLLRPQELRPFFGEMCNAADDTIANFKDGRNLNIADELSMLAIENVGILIFGQRLGLASATPNPKARAFAEAVRGHASAEAKLVFSVPFHEYFKTPTLKQLYRCMDKEWEITEHFVKKANEIQTPLTNNCLLHRLTVEDKMSPEEILQISEMTFSGGVHTTSSTIIILLHTLSKQPEAQQNIYEELQRVLPDNEQPTYEQFLKLPYVKAFMKEVFRTHPTPVGNVRVLEKPIVLSGYNIPPGVRIIFSAVATESMQEKSFGPDFAAFAPERWLHSTRNMHAFGSLPFGFGPRMCAGRRFAEMEMAVFLIRLLQKYEVLESKEHVEWYFNLIDAPTKSYNMNLKKRI